MPGPKTRLKVVKGGVLYEVDPPRGQRPRIVTLDRDTWVTGQYLEDRVWEVKYNGVLYTVDHSYVRLPQG